MSNKNNKRKTKFKIWESAKANCDDGRFMRMSNSLMLHPTTMSLSGSAYKVLGYMILESAGKRVFEFPRKKWRNFMSNSTFQSAKNELIKKGYIELLESGRITKTPNLYRFSSGWKTYKQT